MTDLPCGTLPTDHEDLNFCIEKMCTPSQIKLTKAPIKDKQPENQAYGGYLLELNNKKVLFRVGKVTNHRPGAFVTLWQRCSKRGRPIPFDYDDPIKYFFIFVKGFSKTKRKEYRGQFFFHKNVLLEKGILSKNKKGGKLGMRLFPPWSEQLAKESIQNSISESIPLKKTQSFSTSARRAQSWQAEYFVSFSAEKSIDFERVLHLCS